MEDKALHPNLHMHANLLHPTIGSMTQSWRIIQAFLPHLQTIHIPKYLLVPPTIVAFIASACISKSDLGLSRVERWKKGVTKNEVSTFVYYANQSESLAYY